MLIERIQHLLDYSGRVIAHGVNAKGKMGAGLAKLIREKYPIVYDKYMEAFGEGLIIPGRIQVVDVPDGKKVVNMCTQEDYGRDETRKYAKVEYIDSCLEELVNYLKENGITEVAMPRVGCNMAGLDWDGEVKPLILKFSKDIDIVICHMPDGEYKV